MRGVLLSLAIVAFVMITPTTALARSDAPAPVAAVSLQPPGEDFNIDVDITDRTGTVWYRNPVWIAIGAIAIVVLLVILVLAMRGGGTTIIKE